MADGTMVNIDVTAPGATLALALMFMKVVFPPWVAANQLII